MPVFPHWARLMLQLDDMMKSWGELVNIITNLLFIFTEECVSLHSLTFQVLTRTSDASEDHCCPGASSPWRRPARRLRRDQRSHLQSSDQIPAAAWAWAWAGTGGAVCGGAAKGKLSCAGDLVPPNSQRVPVHGTGSQCLRLLSSLFPLMSVLPPPLCSSLSLHWCCKVDSACQSAWFDSGFTLRVSGLFGL